MNNCKPDSTTKIVTVNPSPTVSLGSDIAVLENGTVNFKPFVSNIGLSYLWYPGTFLNSNSILTPFALPKNDITYTLTVTGVGGCKASDDISIKILKMPTIPNVFSPKGDGINDTWVIKYLNDFPGATVDVFNRYGASVFSSNGYARP